MVEETLGELGGGSHESFPHAMVDKGVSQLFGFNLSRRS
jgi:hypothetical protein